MSSGDVDFEVRVRLRRNATPDQVVAEMVADGFEEAASRRAMSGLLDRRRLRKQYGLFMLAGGLVLCLGGLAIILTGALPAIIGYLAMSGGLGLVAKGGSDAFSF